MGGGRGFGGCVIFWTAPIGMLSNADVYLQTKQMATQELKQMKDCIAECIQLLTKSISTMIPIVEKNGTMLTALTPMKTFTIVQTIQMCEQAQAQAVNLLNYVDYQT